MSWGATRNSPNLVYYHISDLHLREKETSSPPKVKLDLLFLTCPPQPFSAPGRFSRSGPRALHCILGWHCLQGRSYRRWLARACCLPSECSGPMISRGMVVWWCLKHLQSLEPTGSPQSSLHVMTVHALFRTVQWGTTSVVNPEQG